MIFSIPLIGEFNMPANNSNPYALPYKPLLGQCGLIHPLVKFGKNVTLGHGVIIEEGCEIGDNTLIGHYCVLRPSTKIARDCKIGHFTVFEGDSIIGDRVLIHAQCHITKGVIIEDDVFIAPFFCGANTARIVHGRSYLLILDPYIIKRAARIAIDVLVLPGVIIGENVHVGAGSLVTRNIPDGECWLGAPAVFKSKVPKDELL